MYSCLKRVHSAGTWIAFDPHFLNLAFVALEYVMA